MKCELSEKKPGLGKILMAALAFAEVAIYTMGTTLAFATLLHALAANLGALLVLPPLLVLFLMYFIEFALMGGAARSRFILKVFLAQTLISLSSIFINVAVGVDSLPHFLIRSSLTSAVLAVAIAVLAVKAAPYPDKR